MHVARLSPICAALVAVACAAGPAWSKDAPEGPDTSIVHVGPADVGTSAFVAWPANRTNAASVVVVHEWWGLNSQIRDFARRLSREGYVAIVPDLYHGQVATDPEMAHELVRGLEDSAAIGDLEAAVAWLRKDPSTAKRRIGVVGFCMGGRLSQLLGLHSKDVSATVMFYGSPETDAKTLATLSGPLQAHFGAADRGIPTSKADDLKKGLKASGKQGEVYVYPGAGHAFMNEARPSYHRDAARQAWARTLSFFQKYLKG